MDLFKKDLCKTRDVVKCHSPCENETKIVLFQLTMQENGRKFHH